MAVIPFLDGTVIEINTINMYLREYPEDKVKELIVKRMSNPNLERKSHQTWFDVYGIQV